MTETVDTRRPSNLAGIAGLVFVAGVVVTNVVRAGSPAPDATTAELVDHFADGRAREIALVAGFAVAGLALAIFVAGLWTRLRDHTGAEAWIRTGVVGAIGVFSAFSLVMATEMGVVIAAGRRDAAATVPTLWILQSTVFVTLYLALGIALLGLSQAAVRAGLAPAAFGPIGAVAALGLLVGTVLGPISADDAPVAALPALAGFLTWLVFVVVVGLRLRRG